MTTAFVLSGGGSLGAVQVGMLQALGELAVLWRSLRRRDVFALRPLRGVLAAVGVRPSLFTTDLLSGQEVMLSSGDAASAVVASAAIPGVFPPVYRKGRVLVDGGIAEHTAIRHAIDRGADEVYLLPAGYPCALQAAPTTAVGVALQALTLLSQQQLIGEVARYAGPAKLKVLPPLCPLKVSAADFSHADELIIRAHKATGSWLDSGGPDLAAPQQFLSMHDHNQAPASATTRSDQTPMELKPDR